MTADATDHGAPMSVRYNWSKGLWPLLLGAGMFIFGMWVLKRDILGVGFKDLDFEDVLYTLLVLLAGPVVMGFGLVTWMARLRSQLASGLELLVDDRGLHHYILGTVPWSEIKELTYVESEKDEDTTTPAKVRIVLGGLAYRRLDPHMQGWTNFFIRRTVGHYPGRKELELSYSAPQCDPHALWQRMCREVKF
jgi:hypothetical protein